ncbi:MAG TPA: electron transfer flavoprotein subunit beta/FixA family protein [Nocardioidaceae bacterium]|nr:electron transfer flavoprotein subunit beta/FixA family protein [Nocardioidaceae bacterium]
MARVLVCVKRVPDTAGEILLTDDQLDVDARYVGYTVSPHESCAVEMAVRIAQATDGEATVFTLGPAEAVEQLRDALAVGCTAAVHVEADGRAFGPADVAREVAEVVRRHSDAGTPYDLVVLGNDAADTGDFQVGIRLAHLLGWPVVTGISTVEVSGETLTARGDGPESTEVFEMPLPAVVTVMEGGVEPRYPSIPGRMKAKRVPIETVQPSAEPVGSGRVRLTVPPAPPSQVQVLGSGPEAAPAVVDLLEKLGVTR